jgi:hypothetical protein
MYDLIGSTLKNRQKEVKQLAQDHRVVWWQKIRVSI